MKKLLSVVLAIALVLGSMAVFAAENPYQVNGSAGTNLKHYGFIEGYPGGDLKENDLLTREQLVLILAELYGQKEEAAAFTTESGYADESKFPAWSKNQISWAKAKGFMTGKPGNIFDNKGSVKAEDLATALLRVLGYSDGVYGQNAERLSKLTGVELSSEKITRGEAFSWMWPTVSMPITSEEKVLGVEIGKLQEVKPVAKSLEVTSVKADNLKQVMVYFNQEVSKDSVAASNFSLSPSAGKLTASLSSDGLSVVLTAENALTNQKEYTLTSKGLVSAADATQMLSETKTKFVAFDSTLPSVLDVQFTGPKNVTITFSEPVKQDSSSKLIVKSGLSNLSANLGAATGYGTNQIAVPLYVGLTDGKTYTVEVKGFKDYAGYENVNKVAELTYAKDDSAPVASIVSAEQEYLIVEFSKPVKGVTAKHFAHTFSAYLAKKVYQLDGKTEVSASDVVKKVKVVFYSGGEDDKALPEGDVKVMVLGKAGNVQIQDLWGNKLADSEFTVKVSADKSMPEVKSVKAKDSKTIEVKFNKSVKLDKSNVEVLDKDGKKISGLYVTVSDGPETFKLGLSKSMEGKMVILNLRNVKDTTLNANKMADYTETVDFGDTTAPEVTKVAYEAATNTEKNNGVLYFFFSEDVDAATALVASNYQIIDGSNYIKLSQTPEFFNGNNVVKFMLTKSENSKVSGKTFYVANVKDIAGNEIVKNVTSAVESKTEATKIELDEAKLKAIAKNKVQVVFKGAIEGYDISKFTISDNNKIIANEFNGTNMITLTTEKALEDYATTLAAKLTIAADGVWNSFEVKNEAFTTKTIVDAIKPVVVVKDDVKQISFDEATKALKVVFDRSMKDPTSDKVLIAANDVKIYANGTPLAPDKITDVAKETTGSTPADNTIVFTVDFTGIEGPISVIAFETTNDLKYLQSAQGVVVAPIENIALDVDYVAPTVVSVTANGAAAGSKITVTFNEKMGDSAKTEDSYEFAEGASSNSTYATLSAGAFTDGDAKKVVEFTTTTNPLVDKQEFKVKTDVKDAAGNAAAEVVFVMSVQGETVTFTQK